MILNIISHPHPLLRTKAKSVRTLTSDIRTFIQNMVETLYAHPAVGFAANQLGKSLRIIVIDISTERNELHVFINPKIIKKSKEKDIQTEGCMSIPGYEGDVERASCITVKTMNAGEFEASGFLARVIQHEVDHLEGRLYIDHLSRDSGLRRLESRTPRE